MQHNKLKDSVILVTGGAGFIGSYVVEELISLQPKKIIILDNFIRGSRENMKSFIENPFEVFYEGSFRDVIKVDHCIAGSYYVFHMAALRINACAASPRDGFDVMLKSAFEVDEFCKKQDRKTHV